MQDYDKEQGQDGVADSLITSETNGGHDKEHGQDGVADSSITSETNGGYDNKEHGQDGIADSSITSETNGEHQEARDNLGVPRNIRDKKSSRATSVVNSAILQQAKNLTPYPVGVTQRLNRSNDQSPNLASGTVGAHHVGSNSGSQRTLSGQEKLAKLRGSDTSASGASGESTVIVPDDPGADYVGGAVSVNVPAAVVDQTKCGLRKNSHLALAKNRCSDDSDELLWRDLESQRENAGDNDDSEGIMNDTSTRRASISMRGLGKNQPKRQSDVRTGAVECLPTDASGTNDNNRPSMSTLELALASSRRPSDKTSRDKAENMIAAGSASSATIPPTSSIVGACSVVNSMAPSMSTFTTAPTTPTTTTVPQGSVDYVDDGGYGRATRGGGGPEQGEGLLLEAKVVDEPVQAEVVSEEHLADQKQHRSRVMYGGLALLVIAAAIIVAMLAVFLPSSSSGAEEPLNNYDTLVNLLQPVSGDSLLNATTPQYQAFQWLASEDPAELDARTTDSQVVIDRYVLALLFLVTDGPAWTNDFGFLTNSSVCDWQVPLSESTWFSQGVGCNSIGIVNQIGLSYNNLNGTLPNELSALKFLAKVAIVGNPIYGTIPSSYGDLLFVKALQLSRNSLTSTIPGSFGRLSSLEDLQLNVNQLTGPIPPELTQLPLKDLRLYGNQLDGTIPEFQLNSPVNLIQLQQNNFTGSIPESIYTLLDLEELNLAENQLTGTVSTKIGRLTSLNFLSLWSNDFSGPLPTEIGKMFSLKDLYLDENQFNGTIPMEMGGLWNAEYVWLNDNTLTGSIPSELVDLTNLVTLKLDWNNISGEVPPIVAALSSLEWLDLTNTSITGSFDGIFCTLDRPVVYLEADCGGNHPEVNCSCCSICCDDATGECQTNLDVICTNEKKVLELEHEAREETCECFDEGTSSTLSCTDAKCQYCNEDGSVCYIRLGDGKVYGFSEIDESVGNSMDLAWFIEVEYVVGPVGDRVRLELDYQNDTERLFVNDQECNLYRTITCPSGFLAHVVDCMNVREDLFLNQCNTNTGAGVLEIFAGEDYLRGNCIPIT